MIISEEIFAYLFIGLSLIFYIYYEVRLLRKKTFVGSKIDSFGEFLGVNGLIFAFSSMCGGVTSCIFILVDFLIEQMTKNWQDIKGPISLLVIIICVMAIFLAIKYYLYIMYLYKEKKPRKKTKRKIKKKR